MHPGNRRQPRRQTRKATNLQEFFFQSEDLLSPKLRPRSNLFKFLRLLRLLSRQLVQTRRCSTLHFLGVRKALVEAKKFLLQKQRAARQRSSRQGSVPEQREEDLAKL